jgi:hypothetical protein
VANDDAAVEDEDTDEDLVEDEAAEGAPAEAAPPTSGKKRDRDGESGEKGTSLRTRLARSAASKKSGKRSDWS